MVIYFWGRFLHSVFYCIQNDYVDYELSWLLQMREIVQLGWCAYDLRLNDQRVGV